MPPLFRHSVHQFCDVCHLCMLLNSLLVVGARLLTASRFRPGPSFKDARAYT